MLRHFFLSRLVRRAEQITPIFVLGANRSGTSLLASMVAQHPNVYGLFAGPLAEDQYVKDGHVTGYCESNHLWSDLNKKGMRNINVAPLFGLPENLHQLYRTGPSSSREARRLRAAVLRHCPSGQRHPLIKDNLNILRVGLIKELFPDARFILIVRQAYPYIASNMHKWESAMRAGKPKMPAIGLHWFLLNALAIFDLERFAPTHYIMVSFEDLTRDKLSAQKVLDSVYAFLELPAYQADVSCVRREVVFEADNHRVKGFSFQWVQDLVHYEKHIETD